MLSDHLGWRHVSRIDQLTQLSLKHGLCLRCIRLELATLGHTRLEVFRDSARTHQVITTSHKNINITLLNRSNFYIGRKLRRPFFFTLVFFTLGNKSLNIKRIHVVASCRSNSALQIFSCILVRSHNCCRIRTVLRIHADECQIAIAIVRSAVLVTEQTIAGHHALGTAIHIIRRQRSPACASSRNTRSTDLLAVKRLNRLTQRKSDKICSVLRCHIVRR